MNILAYLFQFSLREGAADDKRSRVNLKVEMDWLVSPGHQKPRFGRSVRTGIGDNA